MFALSGLQLILARHTWEATSFVQADPKRGCPDASEPSSRSEVLTSCLVTSLNMPKRPA